MSEVVFMRRTLGSLRAIDPMSAEILERIPQDEDVKVEITRPRNLKHHKKYFALLNAIYPHQDVYPTRISFRAAISAALGFGETIKLPGGRLIIIPHSISFAKMDQAEFEQFYDRAVMLIVGRILPGVNRTDLDREVADILAGRGDADAQGPLASKAAARQLRDDPPPPTRSKTPAKAGAE